MDSFSSLAFTPGVNTLFCVISALGAFEIRINKVPLFISIFHEFVKTPQTFLLILYNLQSQKERGALIRGRALITQNTVVIFTPRFVVIVNVDLREVMLQKLREMSLYITNYIHRRDLAVLHH